MTKTDLANLALANLGANLIVELDEEPLVNPLLNQATAQALRTHDWNFASKILPLAPLDAPGATPPNLPYAFDLPADFSKRIAVSVDSMPLESLDYTIISTRLYSRYDILDLTYVSTSPPIQDWPPDFIQAVATLTASKLAHTLLKQPAIARELLNQYLTIELPEAKKNDVADSPGSLYVHYLAPAATSPSIAARRSMPRPTVEAP